MKLRHTLRLKMLIGFIGLMAPLIAFLFYLNYYSIERIRSQAVQSKNDLLQVHFDNIDTNLERVGNFLIKTVLHDPDLKSLSFYAYTSEQHIYTKYVLANKLNLELQDYPDAENFFIYRTDSDEFVATKQFQNKFINNFDMPAFKEAIVTESRNRWIIVQSGKETALIKIVPADAHTMVGAWINPDRLIAPLTSVESSEEAETLIVTEEGKALTATRFWSDGLALIEQPITKEQSFYQGVGTDGQKLLVIAKKSELAPFYITVSIPETQLFKSLLLFRKAIYAIPIAALLIVILYIAVLQKVLYTPMRNLIQGMAKLGRGDLTVSLPVSDQGEIGYLTNSFNAMVHKIRTIDIWETQRPVILDKFWQDLLGGRKPLNLERLETMISLFQKPIASDSYVILTLISVSQWKDNVSAEEEMTMEYALRNAAEEIILAGLSGDVIQDRNGALFALVYVGADELDKLADIQARIGGNCDNYLNACVRYFCSSLCCYVGKAAPILELYPTYYALLEMERHHTAASNTVYYQKDWAEVSTRLPAVQWTPDWAIPFKLGKWESTEEKLQVMFRDLEQTGLYAKEAIEGFYYSTVYTLYYLLHEEGISVYSVYDSRDLKPPASTLRSVAQFKHWTLYVVKKGIQCFQETKQEQDSIVAKITNYISAHLTEDLSREQLADKVFLNPSYLSRLFKKETGQSLTDYIIHIRMKEAQRLLSRTNMKIVQVSEQSGYHNVSHFSKMFKKVTGITPQEYRNLFLEEIT